MKRFWTAVVRFAYRRVAAPIGKLPDGVPGVRDIGAPCSAYAPRARLAGDSDCAGDGHYLCDECALHSDEPNHY